MFYNFVNPRTIPIFLKYVIFPSLLIFNDFRSVIFLPQKLNFPTNFHLVKTWPIDCSSSQSFDHREVQRDRRRIANLQLDQETGDSINAHGAVKYKTTRQIFKKLVYTNAIKHKVRDPLDIFFQKALTPSGILAE